MARRFVLVVSLLVLGCALAVVGCGRSGSEPTKVSSTVAVTPSAPPVDEETARRFVERFVMAMNAKDNLQLFRMVKPGGTFVVQTMSGDQKMDSATFLKWFQDALRSARTLSFEVTSMQYEPMSKGAVITAELKEEAGSGRNRATGQSRARFVLELDDEDRLQCSRLYGGEGPRK